ncbi:MAG: TIGR01459 family HAD-type hydrolase [Proteobacteria bacterium]|nr:TIGR01459 family HAD-type hydrolase [Pseudomonadota bacterium]
MPNPPETSDPAAPPIPILDGIGALADRYDGFVLDLWGVIHNGVEPYPGAVDTLERLKAAGKRTILLSNAPRRAASVIRAMERMGIPRTAYGDVLSSGEDAWRALKERSNPWHAALGRRCYHIGPARDRGMLEGLDIDEVDTAGEADFLLNTGVDMDHETVADYEAALAAGAQAGASMVCANPDLVVVRGSALVVCAGTLALRYEELGGAVFYHGKPHAPVYRTCLDMMGIADRSRILACGDALRTDLAGARAAGIDAVLLPGGIHAEELGIAHGEKPDPAALTALCQRGGERPVAAIPAFVW